MLKVDQIAQIRRAYYIEEKSIRQIAREFNHSRATIRKALISSQPQKYTMTKERPAPVLGPYKERINELLAESEQMPRKQRYTWHKIYKIIEKEGYQGSGSNLRHYLAKQRKSKRRPKVYLPLEFDPGQEAQVDWGEAQVIMQGKPCTVQLFVMRLNYSRRTFVMAFPSQKQEAFFLGHVRAFHYFGGIPQRISYDNLKTAVHRILSGKNREEQERFIEFRSHYLFDPHYCTPGQAHEKGGVEHAVGYVRRNFLVPLPEVKCYRELNIHLLGECQKDEQRVVSGQDKTIHQAWLDEHPYLRHLPSQDYPCCVTLPVTLTPYSQVIIETNRYSVPAQQSGKELIAKVYPFWVEIYRPKERMPLASHPRCYERQQDIFDPLHYLSLLQQRPGAFYHAKPIREWRQQWPQSYERLLEQLLSQWPDGRGLREFIQILRLHKKYPAEVIEQAIEQAFSYGCVHTDGVQLCIHQLEQPDPDLSSLDLQEHPHLQHLGQQDVDLAAYDQLLGGVSCP
jgi:transposase